MSPMHWAGAGAFWDHDPDMCQGSGQKRNHEGMPFGLAQGVPSQVGGRRSRRHESQFCRRLAPSAVQAALSRVVSRSANQFTDKIRKFRSPSTDAGVAKLADAQDLKSWVRKRTCGFDPRPRHQ